MDMSTLSTSVQSTLTFELSCCHRLMLIDDCSGSTVMSRLGCGGMVVAAVCA